MNLNYSQVIFFLTSMVESSCEITAGVGESQGGFSASVPTYQAGKGTNRGELTEGERRKEIGQIQGIENPDIRAASQKAGLG